MPLFARFMPAVAICTALLVGASPGNAAGHSTKRMTITNNCGADAWMIMTPPGSPKQGHVRALWAWWEKEVGAHKKLATGSTLTVAVPNGGAPSGNLRFFMGCDKDGPTNCIIGALSGDLAGINTLFEPTFGCDPALDPSECAFNPSSDAGLYPKCAGDPTKANCGPISSDDYIDISVVDGYTIPMSVEVTGATCVGGRNKTDAGMLSLADCPSETDKTLFSTDPAQQAAIKKGVSLLAKDARGYNACAAPGFWFSSTGVGSPANPNPLPPDGCTSGSFYSCAGSCAATGQSPGAGAAQCEVGPKFDGSFPVNKTNYVTKLKADGYKGYTWQYDDAEGLQQCAWGGTMALTLCPKGGLPYKP